MRRPGCDTHYSEIARSHPSFGFETATVAYPALSPARFWHAMTTDSGGIMLAVDAVPEADRDAMEGAMVEALDPFFSEAGNAMALEYRLVTATVSG